MGGLEDSRNEGRGTPGWVRAIRQASLDVGEMHRAGVKVLAGTDAGAPFVLPDEALYQELERLVSDAGLSPADTLRAAIVEPARLFGMERQLGVVAPGYFADLILLEENPLQDISYVRQVHTVILAGRVFDPAARAALRSKAMDGIRRLWLWSGTGPEAN